jgi:hypothetical protein
MALPIQTMYAELVERSHAAQLASEFDTGGSFYRTSVKGRDYWYFRSSSRAGHRLHRYVGPDSPALRRRIEQHQTKKTDLKERRALVVALLSTGLQRPDPLTGRILEALAAAGAFRMRTIVVGTIAYQTYPGLLGVKLGGTAARTEDLDIAQFADVSAAVEDEVELPLLEILRSADRRFEPLGGAFDSRHVTRYLAGNYRVDVLTPNRGPDSDAPVPLPALKTAAQPLRYLDFLIRDEVQAVVLHGSGVPVNVPAPERYCLHKLIVSRARIETTESQAKARKDLQQAARLLSVLCDYRPDEIRDLWEELNSRGPSWREKAVQAVRLLDVEMGSSTVREKLEAVVGASFKSLA